MLARHELDDTSKELLSAADYIEKHGWIKYMRLSEGKVCALGAIDQARGAINPTGHVLDFWKFAYDRTPSVNRLARAVGYGDHKVSFCPGPAFSIISWNNEPGRTAEEVISKMREVAYDPQYAKV